MQFLLEPDAGRRAAKEIIVVGKRLPNLAMVVLNRAAIDTARRNYASDSGSGYEIWREGHRIHTEFPTLRHAA